MLTRDGPHALLASEPRFAGQSYGYLAAYPDRHSRSGKAGPRKCDVAGVNSHPVPASASDGRGHGKCPVLRFFQMPGIRDVRLDKRRLEQARIEVAHFLRGADRRQVGSPLIPRLGAECVAEREQHRSARKHRGHDPHQQQRRLAALAATLGAVGSRAEHRPHPVPGRVAAQRAPATTRSQSRTAPPLPTAVTAPHLPGSP
jgi:hypothetical protein